VIRLTAVIVVIFGAAVSAQTTQPIDRQAVVARHNITVSSFDPLSPLSVGNGEFAFTVDPTGLQTFPEIYEPFTPLCTQSQWGWHTIPMPSELKGQQLRYSEYETYGRKVGYMTGRTGQEPLYNWHRENPHRLHLGRVALELRKADGTRAAPDDLKNVRQTLDLWTGILSSEFEFLGKPVKVRTCCAGDTDGIAVRIESPLAVDGVLAVSIAFPYGSSGRAAVDWSKPDAHQTSVGSKLDRRIDLIRKLDEDRYHVSVTMSEGTTLAEDGPHRFVISSSGPAIEFACAFAAEAVKSPQTSAASFDASQKFWRDFWTSGGAVDLSGSTDPRWRELERRIVLSQYVTRVNCAGSLPPQETGLVCNSWYGKFHLEMHWWHDVHFALWNRIDLMQRAMPYYQKILPKAREIARRQGYKGARWPKMVGPDGTDSPSPIGPLLIWQQPHPIYYAELCYRAQPDRKTLEQWQQIVEESAEFMASYPVRDPSTGKFNLGPPVKIVSEHNETNATRNPTYELIYWRFGLETAQQWRERMGLPRNPQWDEVLKDLAPLPVKDGLYLRYQDHFETFTADNWEHPDLIGGFGMLPGNGADPRIMRATLEKVMQVWQWDRCWGWDFPMTAMSAARVGRPDLAVDALLIESIKNKCHPSGHVYQRENLTLYLPANGGLLSAVAMMCAGWDGAPTDSNAPGFPRDGWSVRWEGLSRMP
jgi:protein-glucosylgalactosylhydroxylysine glucosidase